MPDKVQKRKVLHGHALLPKACPRVYAKSHNPSFFSFFDLSGDLPPRVPGPLSLSMRRTSCAQYSECLGIAALQNSPGLPCGQCPEYVPGESYLTRADIQGCRLLLFAVFSPEAMKRIREVKRFLDWGARNQ
jgi:hypothetical protein